MSTGGVGSIGGEQFGCCGIEGITPAGGVEGGMEPCPGFDGTGEGCTGRSGRDGISGTGPPGAPAS